MSGIAGIIRWDDNPLRPKMLQRMVGAMAYWGPDGCHLHQDDTAGLAYFHSATTPEAVYESQPCLLPSGERLAAAARLDNRGELCHTLQIEPAQAKAMSDGALLARAYLHWGEAAVHHLLGDWAFAVWNPTARRLFLARDHFGITSLYYHANPRYLAFASSCKALLGLDPALHSINDLYVAQVLLAWPVYHGSRSVYAQLQRLPPAYTLTATAQASQTHCYWRMEDVQPLPLRTLDEAVEGFNAIFERAVEDRLRAAGPVAATLSGGLDSGSVTAIAAPRLAAQKRSLTAYTSVPFSAEYSDGPRRFGNEWELASATATFAGINHHYAVRAESITPLLGIEEMLWVHDTPHHAAGNAYWLVDLLRTARAEGARVLLTGQGGNAGISWTGRARPPDNHPSRLNFYAQARSFFFRLTPATWRRRLRIWKMAHHDAWLRNSHVHPDLVRRTRAVEHSTADGQLLIEEQTLDVLAQRFHILKPGRTLLGAYWHENGAAFGMDVRDPTVDVRVLTYCLAVPAHLFMDPDSGLDRMLIRRAMEGRLPDVVRLNRKQGLQGADLVVRLRADAANVTACLDQFAAGAASAYLNVANLRQSWARIQQQNSPAIQQDAGRLLRAILAGLFVQQPHYPRPRPTLPPIPHFAERAGHERRMD